MTRGVAGYGRYDDNPDLVGCPWARNDTTPCVARNGNLALSVGRKGSQCTGCGNTLEYLYEDLTSDYEPARDLIPLADPAPDATRFQNIVYRATRPPDPAGDGDDRA